MPGPLRQLVATETLTKGKEGVKVGKMIGDGVPVAVRVGQDVSVGKGVNVPKVIGDVEYPVNWATTVCAADVLMTFGLAMEKPGMIQARPLKINMITSG